MAYGGNPADSPQDATRYYAGDTDPTQNLLTNEEVEFALEQEGSDPKRAAISLLTMLSRRYARLADYREGPVAESLSQLSKAYADHASAIAASGNPRPWAGGIRVSDKQARTSDSDLVKPFFRREVMP